MRTNKKIFLLVLISFFLLPCVFGAQVNASAAAFSDVVWVEENGSTAQEATDAASSGSIEADQTVAEYFQGNLTGTIQGGHQMLQLSSVSNSASFSRHLMCKDFDPVYYTPIDPTTIFRPSDTKAVCLTTVSINDTIEFRWHFRSNSSKTWVSYFNYPMDALKPGEYHEYHYEGYLNIAGQLPGLNYPRVWKVDVYLDGSFSFSEFFEVTNGGLNSPRMCKGVDVNGDPINMKSRFTIDADTKAQHYLRFDKLAYFNEELGCCHNFTTVWIQPNGSTYKTYSGNFTDYKDSNVTWNYWEFNYTQDDYISINSSTPVGNWKVEVYLDSYYFNNTWKPYGPAATTPFVVGNETVADWTFMVYLDADIDIIGTENASINIFLKMASVNSSSRVNIVVQMDRIPGHDSRYGDWRDCKRFNVTEGMTPTPENAVMNVSEVNMGDPNTLKNFVNWTINNYPANYYFLVLWDHGAGLMGLCFDFFDKPGPLSPPDFLSLPEISQALSGLPAIMDVVFLDACSMAMTEVAYQITDYANVLVGPEGLGIAMVDSLAAPYDNYLSSLTSNSSMLPSAFATEVVTDYINWCNSTANIHNATMSAIDLTKITSLVAAVDDFAIKLKENESLYNYLRWGEEIELARNLTEGYIGPYAGNTSCYMDLYNFTQLTYQYVLDEEIRNAADQVMTTLESIIIIEADKRRPNSHGLSIFFPNETRKYESLRSEYEETTFAEDTSWDEFVKHHLLHQHQCYITVNSTYGNPTPSQWVDEGGNLTVTVTSPNGTIPNQTQWNCTGYKIDNGDLQEGTSYSFENVQEPHKIEFYWVQQFWLQVNTTESGSPIEGTGWYDAGTNASISATTPYQLNSTHRFVFTLWNSTGINEAPITDPSSPHTTVTMNNYSTVQANWQIQYHLTVNSAYGMPTGQDWYDPGTQVIFSVRSPVDHDNGTRRVFIQWTGDSNATTTNATIIMDSPHTVTANWKTQYFFTVGVDPSGITTISGDGWYDNGTAATTGTAELSINGVGVRYVFVTWMVDSSNVSGNPIEVPIDSPYTAIAIYNTVYSSSIPPLSLSLNKIEKGQTITVSGSITPAHEGVTVTLMYKRPDGSTSNRTVISSFGGAFSDTYTPDAAGTWSVTASWPGDADHDGATSSVVSFRVTTRAWWETLFRPEMLQVILGLVGVVLTVAFVGTAWVRTRRRRGIIKALLNEIDEVYSTFKTNPPKCEEELYRLRNTVLEGLTDGKITEENYNALDKRIDKYLEELRKQKWRARAD